MKSRTENKRNFVEEFREHVQADPLGMLKTGFTLGFALNSKTAKATFGALLNVGRELLVTSFQQGMSDFQHIGNWLSGDTGAGQAGSAVKKARSSGKGSSSSYKH